MCGPRGEVHAEDRRGGGAPSASSVAAPSTTALAACLQHKRGFNPARRTKNYVAFKSYKDRMIIIHGTVQICIVSRITAN
ncbi:jg11291 [Pararge aegeria aegeria]|uniref:Jg11291 protein n=1 Tax=Pararge aegeria aegeria TaxID=348720 RepID=A0A8S4R0U3_9NEOP|nr:jg11291 [Pararge aegeria aegeria]